MQKPAVRDMFRPYVDHKSTAMNVMTAAQLAVDSHAFGKLPEWAQDALHKGGSVKACHGALVRLHTLELELARQWALDTGLVPFLPIEEQEALSAEVTRSSKLWPIANALRHVEYLRRQAEDFDNRQTPKSNRSKGKRGSKPKPTASN